MPSPERPDRPAGAVMPDLSLARKVLQIEAAAFSKGILQAACACDDIVGHLYGLIDIKIAHLDRHVNEGVYALTFVAERVIPGL